MAAPTHTYHGRYLPDLKNEPVVFIHGWRGRGPHNVKVSFINLGGIEMSVPVRCLRKIKKA